MELVEGTATVGESDEQSQSSRVHESVDAFVERVSSIADRYGVVVQTFDARYVVDRTHLERAVELADRAFARDDAIARDRGVEMLLYAAGRRQINRALTMGVDEGETPVVAVVHSPVDTGADEESDAGDESDTAGENERAAADAISDLLEPAETLGEYDDERVREFFDIGQRELDATDAALADLVRERVALLTVEK